MHRDPDVELLLAGRFATQALLSAKALRLYAERGLLTPHRIDAVNGYRYYHPDQVRVGRLIALLRSADLPLERVEHLMRLDPVAALAALDGYAATLDRQAEAHRAVLARARQYYRPEDDMSDVTVHDVTETVDTGSCVLSALRRVEVSEIDEVISATLGELRAAAEEAGVAQTGDPFGIFHNPVTEDSDGPLEICLAVADVVPLTGDLRSYRLPGGRLACRRATGAQTDYPGILAVYDEVAGWVNGQGHQLVGPPREVWHSGPDAPDGLTLSVCWPFA